MCIGFILAIIALLGISNASVIEKFLVSSNLNPFTLVALLNFISGIFLIFVILLFKFFNVSVFGDISFKHTYDSLLSNSSLLVFFIILCLICSCTKLCIFSSLKFISPFQLNLILGMMPVVVLLFSSLMGFDSISLKTVVSLILFLLAISIQIFL
jgi:drug/metabolite transporter (DMT)-like permease